MAGIPELVPAIALLPFASFVVALTAAVFAPDALPHPNIEAFVAEYRDEHGESPYFAGPSAYELAVDVDAVASTVTTERAARVDVSVTNTGDDPVELRSRQGEILPSREPFGDGPGLVLMPADDSFERSSTDCRRLAEGVVYTPECEPLVFDPGERKQGPFELWTAAEEDRCLPPRRYLFVQGYGDPEKASHPPTAASSTGVSRSKSRRPRTDAPDARRETHRTPDACRTRVSASDAPGR